MTETKWTPGPWRVGKGGPNLCPTIGTHKGLMVAMVAYGNDHPTQANAHLMAAAPDLYGVLDWAIQSWDEHNKHGFNMQGDWVQDARAALAKARGDV